MINVYLSASKESAKRHLDSFLSPDMTLSRLYSPPLLKKQELQIFFRTYRYCANDLYAHKTKSFHAPLRDKSAKRLRSNKTPHRFICIFRWGVIKIPKYTYKSRHSSSVMEKAFAISSTVTPAASIVLIAARFPSSRPSLRPFSVPSFSPRA